MGENIIGVATIKCKWWNTDGETVSDPNQLNISSSLSSCDLNTSDELATSHPAVTAGAPSRIDADRFPNDDFLVHDELNRTCPVDDFHGNVITSSSRSIRKELWNPHQFDCGKIACGSESIRYSFSGSSTS